MAVTSQQPLGAWAEAQNQLLSDNTLSDDERKWLRFSDVDGVLSELNQLDGQNADQSKAWKLKRAIQPLLQALEPFGPAMDVLCQTEPNGVLSLVWGSLRIVIVIAKSFQKYIEEITDFLTDIGAPLIRLYEYGRLLPESKMLTKALTAVFAKFLDFTHRTRQMFVDKANRATFQKLGKVIFKQDPWRKYKNEVSNDILAIKKLCDDAREEARLAVDQSNAKNNQKLGEFFKDFGDFKSQTLGYHEAQKRQAAEDKVQREKTLYRDVVNWLMAVDADDQLDRLNKKRFPETCNWVLENPTFQDWLSADSVDDAPPILWIHGIPGSGKSYISARCIEALKEIGTVAFFFCDTKEQKTRSTLGVLRTWIKQLLHEHSGRLPEVAEVYFKETPNTKNLLKALNVFLKAKDVSWLVLDGLDECEPESRMEILDICNEVSMRTKILITSRKENDISQRIAKFGDSRSATIKIEPEDNRQDIQLYLDEKVRDMGIDNEELEQKIKRKLSEEANGMFLWVRLMIDEFDEIDRNDELEEALEHLPDGLEEIYARVLDRINYFKRDSRKQSAKELLQWIACAMEPLTVHEIEHALAITADEHTFNPGRKIRRPQDFILEVCGPLVEIGEGDEIVRLVHASIKDFLLSQSHSASVTQYLVDEEDAHIRISRACLTYLCYENVDFVPVNSDRKASHDNLEKRLASSKVLNYSTIHWWRHVLRAPIRDGLEKTLDSFLTSEATAVYWLQIFHKLRGDVSGVFHPGPNPAVALFPYLLQVRSKWRKHSSKKTWLDNLHESIPGWSFRWYCYLTSLWFSYFHPIQIASFFDFKSVVESQLDKGVDVNTANDKKETALLCAARGDAMDCVRLLLQSGADVNWVGDQSEVAFHRAVSQYCLVSDQELESLTFDCVDLLLDAGINVHQSNFAGDRFIHYVCRMEQETEKLVKLLESIFDHGGIEDINVKNNARSTPLHLAAHNGHSHTTAFLLERGADPDGSPEAGQQYYGTPLQSACCSRVTSIAKSLIEAGANVNLAEPARHRTPLHVAAHAHSTILEDLLKAGADPNAQDKDGRLPMHDAVAENSVEHVRLLIQYGSNINVKDLNGKTALDIAIDNGFVNVIKALKGADASSIPQRSSVKDESGKYFPNSEKDVLHTFFLLRCCTRDKLAEKSLIAILNIAEYWVKTVVERSTEKSPITLLQKDVGPAYISSSPITSLSLNPVRKIVFTTKSHDQGFSDKQDKFGGTEQWSWTGFRARIIRTDKMDAEKDEEHHIHVNRHAVFTPRVHVNTWSADHHHAALVKGLKRGDIVELIPYAVYPGWQNFVYSAKLEIYTSCFAV